MEVQTIMVMIPAGYKTTEFWITIIGYLLAAMITLNRDMPWYVVVGIMGGAVLQGVVYTAGRVTLKAAAATHVGR